MGKPMARNLLKAGVDLYVNDLNLDAAKALAREGAKEATAQAIGENCDIIFTILPNGPIVQEVIFGKDGVATNIKKSAVICDMSSVTPNESHFCYGQLKGMGVGFVDAPVSGGEPKAIDGTLAFMAGAQTPEANFLAYPI